MQLSIFRSLMLGLAIILSGNQVFAQRLQITLSNPVRISATQISWDINVQNVDAAGNPGTGIMSIATANLPVRTTSGFIVPSAATNPLSIVLAPPFHVLSFAPQIAMSSGNTVYRLNGGEPPLINPEVPTAAPVKLGTVTYTSSEPIPANLSIGSTVAMPNVSISGRYNGKITTFQLRNGNLSLPNSVDEAVITFAPIPKDLAKNNAKAVGVTGAYPSPTSDRLTVQFESLEEMAVTLQIFDFNGRLVLQQEILADKGVNLSEVDMTGLQAGTYSVQIASRDAVSSQVKVVKL